MVSKELGGSMDESIKFKRRLLIVLGILGLLFVISFVFSMRDAGKATVEIFVIPEDAKVQANGEDIGSGRQKLKPGNYTFSATKDGFSKDEYTTVVDEEGASIYLLPVPKSEEALQWLEDNPEIVAEREALAGERASVNGAAFNKANPIVSVLPYSTYEPLNGIEGPFSIDYGPTDERPNGIFLVVTTVSPNGRQNALTWLREQGFDPVDYDIQFPDYPGLFNTEAVEVEIEGEE